MNINAQKPAINRLTDEQAPAFYDMEFLIWPCLHASHYYTIIPHTYIHWITLVQYVLVFSKNNTYMHAGTNLKI